MQGVGFAQGCGKECACERVYARLALEGVVGLGIGVHVIEVETLGAQAGAEVRRKRRGHGEPQVANGLCSDGQGEQQQEKGDRPTELNASQPGERVC